MVDGDARVVGLDQGGTVGRAAIELHDIRDRLDAVADEARQDAPLAFGPLAEVSGRRREESLGVAPPFAGKRRLAEDLDVVAGHHAQATASEHAIDVGGRHGSLLGRPGAILARGPASAPPHRCRSFDQQQGRVIDAGVGAGAGDQLLGSSCQRHRRIQKATPVAVLEMFVQAVAAQRKHVAASRAHEARRSLRASRRCRPCVPDRRQSHQREAPRRDWRRCRHVSEPRVAAPLEATSDRSGNHPPRRASISPRTGRAGRTGPRSTLRADR